MRHDLSRHARAGIHILLARPHVPLEMGCFFAKKGARPVTDLLSFPFQGCKLVTADELATKLNGLDMQPVIDNVAERIKSILKNRHAAIDYLKWCLCLERDSERGSHANLVAAVVAMNESLGDSFLSSLVAM
eukprot:821134-Pelagomonas_calceolata.AAC.1